MNATKWSPFESSTASRREKISPPNRLCSPGFLEIRWKIGNQSRYAVTPLRVVVSRSNQRQVGGSFLVALRLWLRDNTTFLPPLRLVQWLPRMSVRSALSPELLQEIVRRIVGVAQPDRIILFGSGARGDMRPGSDLDFLVVKADVAHRGHLAEEIYMALAGIGVPVDIIVVTPQDVQRFKDRVGTIIPPALREGREIYVA